MKMQAVQQGEGIQGLSMNDSQCVWMKVGVVNFKTCENAFDCTSCTFDKGFSKEWWEAMQNQPYLQKECRHMLTGRVIFKLCSHNFNCQDCAYDQFLYEYDQTQGAESMAGNEDYQVHN